MPIDACLKEIFYLPESHAHRSKIVISHIQTNFLHFTGNSDCNYLVNYYDQIFPLDFLSVSRRMTWKNKNAVCHVQISALVPELFKFEKWVNYANETTDDVIHSTQYHIKYQVYELSWPICSAEHWNLAD